MEAPQDRPIDLARASKRIRTYKTIIKHPFLIVKPYFLIDIPTPFINALSVGLLIPPGN